MAGKTRESDVSSTASGANGEWEHEKNCIVCGSRVTKTPMGSNKRYGCKFCNHAVCSKCSPNRDLHPDTGKSERICNNCFKSKDDVEAKAQMAETIAQASSEIARLETQLQEATRARQNEEVMRVRKERECEELKGKVFALSCELSAASDQVHAVELEKVKGELSKLQEKTEGVERANEAFKIEIDQKKTELISYLTELKEAKSQLIDQRELQVQLKSAQDSLLKATSQVQDLQHANSALETATATLTDQLQLSQTTATRAETLQTQIKELESARNALQGQLAAKEKEASSHLTEALQRVKVAEAQLEEWETAKQRADQERTQEERLVTSKIAALQQTVSDFTAAAEEQRHACERKDALIESLEQQVREAHNALKTASETESTQLTQLRAKLQQAEEHSSSLQKTTEELSLTSKQAAIDLALVRSEVSTLTKDRDSLQSELRVLQVDLKSSQNSLEDWRQRCSAAQQEAAALSDKLAASVSALEGSQQLAQSERQRYTSEENALKRSHSQELESSRRHYELQIGALTAEIQTLKEKKATLDSTLEALNAVKEAKSKQELELTACQERLRTLEEVQSGLERRSNESLARHKAETESSAKLLESLREDKLRLTADLAQSGMATARAEERGKELAEERDRVGKELEELRLSLSRGENEQILTLVSENKELNLTAKQAVEQKHALESELRGQVLTCKSLQTQLEAAQGSLVQAHADLDRIKSLAQEREIEAVRLSQDLTASRDHANRLSAHISDLQQALEAKELEYTAKVRKMSEGGNAEVTRLEEQVQSCRLESVHLEEELHKARLDYARKAHDLEASQADLKAQLSSSKVTIAALQKDLAEEKATYDRDKATALELMDSLNLRLKTQSADLKALEQERTRLRGLLDSTQQSNEELTQHLTQERVSSIKKDKELQKTKKPREVVEDVEDLAVLERKAEEQDAVVRRLTAARSATKTMGERELEEQGFGRKRRGSDPSARDACRCAVF